MPGTPYSSQIDLSISTQLGAGVAMHSVQLFSNLADYINAITFGFTPGFNGRILSITHETIKKATTASKDATLTAKVGSTAMTGGVLSLTTTTCAAEGNATAATAITALNSFITTDKINFTVAATAAFAEGNGIIYVRMINDDTLKALAKSRLGLRTP